MQGGSKVARTPRTSSYRRELIDAIGEFFPPQWFSRFSCHANATWTPQKLFWMAMLMSWDEAPTLSDRFANARDLLRELFPRWTLGQSYSGFRDALLRESPRLKSAVEERLRSPVPEWESHWRVQDWLVLIVDGSRFECPRTVENEQRFGCAGRVKTAPQISQTTLLHMGTGLPWDVRLGPGTESERRHLDEMLPSLPPQSLLTADAGFISYDLCRWLDTHGHSFLLRVGANVHLLKELGWTYEVQGNIVSLWPEKRRTLPPLVLRLIVIEEPGKQPVSLVTNVLEERPLCTETAAIIYGLRWGVEVYYRSFKQTLGHRTLLSRTPDAALLEQTWLVLGTWLLQLMTVKALMSSGELPRRFSAAAARRAVRSAMRHAFSPRRRPSFRQQLERAVIDPYQHHGPKQTRAWPRKKQEQPPSPPKIRLANSKERQLAQRFRDHPLPIY